MKPMLRKKPIRDLGSSLLEELLAFFYWEFARRHGDERRRMAAVDGSDLLAWSAERLPAHFTLPPSMMHRWMAKQLQRLSRRRGQKLNVLGPRGAAKSTLGTLAYPLRVALEG